MKKSLILFGLLGLSLGGYAAITIQKPYYKFHVSADNIPELQTPDGKTLVRFGSLELWPAKGSPIKAEQTGKDQIRVTYQFNRKNFKEEAQTVFHLKEGPYIRIATTVVNSKRKDFVFWVSPPDGDSISWGQYKSGIWTRRKGGIPYERKGKILKTIQGLPAAVSLAYDGRLSGKADQRISLRPGGGNKNPHVYSFMDVYVLPEKNTEYIPAARANNEPAALRVVTGKPFNLFDSSKEKMQFKLEVVNTSEKQLETPLKVLVYDYDGNRIIDTEESLSLKPWEKKTFAYVLNGKKEKMERGIFFVEASLKAHGKETFLRTNVATMPPYTFKHLDQSILGIAAYFDIPDRSSVLNLFKRMGVRWLRERGTTKELLPKYGIVCLSPGHVPSRKNKTDDQLVDELKQWLQRTVDGGNPILEFGNEPNFTKKKKEAAEKYYSYLKLLQRAIDEGGFRGKVKIACAGLAGADPDFLKELKKLGGWELFDIANVHPGRLAETPDVPKPFWAWSYIDAIDNTLRTMKKDGGDKELIMTEVYARTPPHKGDSDSYRSAAENIVLSFILAKAKGIKALFFYQMHDSMHADRGGVNENNTEWHYGLLMRDGTVKPSLLAFCAASEALDGAEFVNYIQVDSAKDKRRMWNFKTPRGNMSVLCDRIDGFKPYPGKFTGFKDPWLKHWKTENAYEFHSSGKSVTVIDEIGRRTEIPVRNGKVKLTLSGAPLIVYGLDIL